MKNLKMKKIIVLFFAAVYILNLSSICFADKIPSVSAQLAPDIVTYEKEIDDKKIDCGATIVEVDLTCVADVPVSDIFLTPYALRDSVHYELLSAEENNSIPTRLEKVYADLIKHKDDFGKMIPDFYTVADEMYNSNARSKSNLGERIQGLNDIASRTGSSIVTYIAKDVFDLTATSKYIDLMNVDGNKLRITFDMRLTDEDETPLFALCDRTTGEYSMVSGEDIIRNDDNTITVYFDGFGEVITFKRSVQSPPIVTGDSSMMWILIIAMALVLFMFLIIFTKKRKHKEYDGVSDNAVVGQK